MQKTAQFVPLSLNKIATAFFAITIACSLGSLTAFADEPIQADGSTELSPAALAAQAEDIASGTWGTCPWVIDANGVLWVYPGESPDCGANTYPPWHASGHIDDIKKAVFVKQGNNMVVDRGITGNLGSIPLFAYCTNLVEVDLTGLDVSHMEHDPNLSCLFEGCKSLVSVDLSPLDTSSITDMSYMFDGCSSLTSLDLTPLDTSKVNRMAGMFRDCSSLTSIDFSKFKTSEAAYMLSMFSGCTSLTTLDLSTFDLTNTFNLGLMFEHCESLTTIYVGDKWNLDCMLNTPQSGPDGRNAMFDGCTSLEGGSGTTYDPDHKGYQYAYIDTADTPGYLTRKGISFRNLNYAFSNSLDGFGYPRGYIIPLQRYELLFGSMRAKQFQQADGEWGGSCYGMSSSSSMMNTAGSGILASGFNAGASLPRKLGNRDSNASIGLNLTAFIETMQISQHADAYSSAFYNNAGSKRVFNYVRSLTAAGHPVIVGVFRTPTGGGGHAILAYGVEPATDGGWLIQVYDNNWPDHGRAIRVSADLNHWSYELWPGATYTDGRLVYFPYDVYANAWNGRGQGKAGGTTNVLSTNSRDFEILDAAGNSVAVVEDGVLQEGASDGVWQHHVMRATKDNLDDEQDVVLTLPNGLCRVENKDASVSKLEASVSDQEQIASVKTSADSVELVVNDSTASTVAMVAPGNGSYEITLESALPQARGKELVEVSGTLTTSGVSVGMAGGALDTSSAVGAIVKINGKVIPSNDKNSKSKASTGIADGKTAVVGGATYKVKSNAAGTVYYHKAPKTKKTVTIPSEVKINGKTYSVTGISKNAFKNSKAQKVVVKSKKLTKKSVKSCFKNAKKLKTVKVKMGSKTLNKKYVKKYKKIFAKGNSGRKVTVK